MVQNFLAFGRKADMELRSSLFVLIYLSIGLTKTDAQAEECSRRHNANLQSIVLAAEQTNLASKSEQIVAVHDAASFCRDNILRRQFEAHQKDYALEGIRSPGDARFLDAARFHEHEQAWTLSMLPDVDSRREAFFLTARMQDLNPNTPSSLFTSAYFSRHLPSEASNKLNKTNLFRQMLETPRPMSANERRSALVKLAQAHAQVPNLEKRFGTPVTAALKAGACAQISLNDTVPCMKALDMIQTEMTPSAYLGAALTGIDWWTQLYSSRAFEEGIRVTALNLSNQVVTGVVSHSNIFDDLTNSFIQTNHWNREQAKDAAFAVLGAIANGGPNTLLRVGSIENDRGIGMFESTSQMGTGLSLIASALNALDSMREAQGLPLYSFPKEVKVSCDNGKPYHFWLAATIAHDLTKKGFNPRIAAEATFISEKAYQVNRAGGGDVAASNYTTSRILSVDPYGPVANVVRSDLAYSASGAVFGAISAKNQEAKANINTDTALQRLVQDGAPLHPERRLNSSSSIVADDRSKIPFGSYLRWNEVFAPNSALKSVIQPNAALLN